MPRRPLGQTGLEVSVLGFGASPLGGVFQASSEGCRWGNALCRHVFDAALQCPPPLAALCRLIAPSPHALQDIDEAEGVAAVKEAFDLGINFFDTSPFYGDTKSETVGEKGG
jgi:L-galactose dehydrogenase